MIKDIKISYLVKVGKPLSKKAQKKIEDFLKIEHKEHSNGFNYNLKISPKYYVEFYFYSYSKDKTFNIKKCKDNNIYDKYIHDGIAYDTYEDMNNDKNKVNYKKYFKIDEPLLLELKNFNIKNVIDKYEYKATRQDMRVDDTIKTNLFKLFKLFEWTKIKTKNSVYTLYYIIDVIEGKNNIRYAQVVTMDGIKNILIFTTNSNMYNYIDKGRLIYIEGYYDLRKWLAFDIMDKKDIPTIINNVIKYINNTDDENTYISTNDMTSFQQKIRLKEAQIARKEAIARAKNEKYINDISDLKNKPFTKNGITFYNDKIIYEGITLDTLGQFDFHYYLKNNSIDDMIDFNDLYNKVILSLVTKWSHYNQDIKWELRYKIFSGSHFINKWSEEEMLLKINDNLLTLTYDKGRYHLNGIRINKLELPTVIQNILCYNDMKDYKQFLETVSKCSLKFHNAIANGVKVKCKIDEDTIFLDLKLKREKNRNYIMVGNKKYGITATSKIIDLSSRNNESYSYYSYGNILKMIYSHTKVPYEKLLDLTQEAMERYKDALKKSEELLAQTLKTLKVEKVTIDDREGYKVKGKSGKSYFVQERLNDEQYKIWELNEDGTKDNNGYRCIVDKSKLNQTGKDALVSRLYALRNDSLISDQVYTLRV